MADQTPNVINVDSEPHRGAIRDGIEYPVGQVSIINAAVNNDVVTAICGRAFGKTATGPFLFNEEAPTIEHQIYEFIYASPTYKLAKAQFRNWLQIYKPILDTSRDFDKGYSKDDLILQIQALGKNLGANVLFWGLDAFENLRGPRCHRALVDEGKDVHPAAVIEVITPMLLGRGGKRLNIGTYGAGIGSGWLKADFRRGQDPLNNPGYFSLTAPSAANPWLTERDLRMMKTQIDDDRAYRQEILGEIVEDDGACFERVKAAFTVPVLRQPEKNIWIGEDPDTGTDAQPFETGIRPARYLIGYDPARSPHGDYGVITAFNATTQRQAFLQRFRGVPFPEQLMHLHNIHKRYHNAVIHYDGNGMGKALADELARTFKDSAISHVWSAKTKETDVSNGRILFHKEQWKFMNIPWQFNEFDCFQMITENPKTKIKYATPKYEAPPGLHDDSVSAALLLSHSMMTSAPISKTRETKSPEMTGRWIRTKKRRERNTQTLRDANRTTF